MEINKDENVYRFALNAIREKGERKRENKGVREIHTNWRGSIIGPSNMGRVG